MHEIGILRHDNRACLARSKKDLTVFGVP